MNKRINKELAIKKGLIENNNYTWYSQLENFYKFLFENYLLKVVDLNKYNTLLKNSDLDFGIAHPTKKQLLDKNCFLNLEYIYILNNFFIEKLTDDDINLLKKNIAMKQYTLTAELEGLIKRSYKDVIKDNYISNNYTNDIYNICYGSMVPSNFVKNNALVIKIFYGKNNKQYSNDEFIDNLTKKKEFIDTLSFEIKKEVKAKLDLECNILTEKLQS